MLERKWSAEKGVQALRSPDAEREFVSLRDIIAFVRRYTVLISICAIVGLLLALAYVATADPVYTAQTEVLIEPKLPTALQQQQPSEVNLSLDTAQIESQIVVMQSEKIARMVIDQLGLMDNLKFNESETFKQRGWDLLKMIFGGSGDSAPAADKTYTGNQRMLSPGDGGDSSEAQFVRERRTMAAFHNGLDVRRDGVSYAIDISFSATDPRLAAEVANAIAIAYVREQLETRTASANRGLQWLEDRIDELRTQMNEAARAAQEFRARHDYRIDGKATMGGEPLGEAGGANGAEKKPVTFEELEATSDSYKKMYESFLQAFTSSVNQQPVSDARVITPASRPLVPSRPRSKLILALGVLAGIIAGLGLAFARQMIDRSVLSSQQLREEFGLDCIGRLPAVMSRWSGFGDFDEVIRSPNTPFSQSIKDIRATIGMISLDKPVRILGITSTSPGEGKSTLASNLAATWATSGARTLLIDADITHSVLTKKLLGETFVSGSGIMPGDPDEAASEIVIGAGQPFDMLSSQSVVAHDLLMAKNLQQLLGNLDRYEMVVVDLPPSTSGNQGLIASSQLDGLLVAVEWGKTPMDLIAELMRVLQITQSSVIGAVLTKVRDPSMSRLRRRAGQAPR